MCEQTWVSTATKPTYEITKPSVTLNPVKCIECGDGLVKEVRDLYSVAMKLTLDLARDGVKADL